LVDKDMLDSFLSGLIVPGVFLLAVIFSVGIINLVRKGLPWERKRKSPFTSQFLRSPGDSVFNKLDELRFDLFAHMFGLAVVPVMLVSTVFVQHVMTGKYPSIAATVFLVALIVATIVVQIVKIVRTTREVRNIRLGYEAELAVGQELNQLMTKGFRVYHDFPADGFNIDHVVIGPTGVFAVETKGRSKPDTGDGRADARVVYDGKSLAFPHWRESKPIEQARRQSQWLGKWLSSAIGDSVCVIPVVAIPGWFIEATGKSDVLVFFGKNPESLFAKFSNGVKLPDQMVQRIAHQVEAKCRDIESKVYDAGKG
jgi:hypothetical protein